MGYTSKKDRGSGGGGIKWNGKALLVVLNGGTRNNDRGGRARWTGGRGGGVILKFQKIVDSEKAERSHDLTLTLSAQGGGRTNWRISLA